MLVFDVTKLESLEHLQYWLKEIELVIIFMHSKLYYVLYMFSKPLITYSLSIALHTISLYSDFHFTYYAVHVMLSPMFAISMSLPPSFVVFLKL